MSESRTDYDRRALTEDQRYLAEDIASSMPDRHDETCGVWSEDGDGCDCPLVMAVADGLHASHVVSVEVERGWNPETHRGERTITLPFRPMPKAEAASPAALDDYRELHRTAIAINAGGSADDWRAFRAALARLTEQEERPGRVALRPLEPADPIVVEVEAASPAALDVMRLPVPAIRRAVEWVEQNIAPKRCDNEGVSDCWRCTTVALARWWSDLLAQEETRA